jgi:hypothetical protein
MSNTPTPTDDAAPQSHCNFCQTEPFKAGLFRHAFDCPMAQGTIKQSAQPAPPDDTAQYLAKAELFDDCTNVQDVLAKFMWVLEEWGGQVAGSTSESERTELYKIHDLAEVQIKYLVNTEPRQPDSVAAGDDDYDISNAVAAIMRETHWHIVNRTFIQQLTPHQYTTREITKFIAARDAHKQAELLTAIETEYQKLNTTGRVGDDGVRQLYIPADYRETVKHIVNRVYGGEA